MINILNTVLASIMVYIVTQLIIAIKSKMFLGISTSLVLISFFIILAIVVGDNLNWHYRVQVALAFCNLAISLARFVFSKRPISRLDIVFDIVLPIVAVVLTIPGIGFKLNISIEGI